MGGKKQRTKPGVRTRRSSGTGARPLNDPVPSVWWGLKAGVGDCRRSRAREERQDSVFPWGISLELLSPAVVAAPPAVSASVPGSPSSEVRACSCCRPPQVALFSPMWPSMVWERRVSEKRAHSANSGSATYVMKPEEGEETADENLMVYIITANKHAVTVTDLFGCFQLY